MSTHRDRSPSDLSRAHQDYREEELLDALVTAAALVARADGWVEPAERRQFLDFLKQHGLLAAFAEAEVMDIFEGRLRQLGEPMGVAAAVASLEALAGRAPARLVRELAELIAVSDDHLHHRELQILRLIRVALGPRAAHVAGLDA
ncbi:hypothetical protein GCM10011611_50370 [Aliidongia dinghuensis]|uniref:Co-chaperone DjlA N-terminal domain-containing protein n=1 Tax=Aliidongia dinghuensis TaxID=1867774 RepID=A0A8J2YYU8_9PROT|nr:TerB family tellurite resistance protein [Aliidongia dinghuensis]GGF37901.1 hypothetical protein GCM10011611_50370 [Aliidongia dinghuensis]